jgi:hypothetical protein
VRKTSPWLPAAPLTAALAVALIAGCARQTPAERVAELRGKYTAELKNFVVREEPPPGSEAPAAEGGEAAAEPAAATEPAAGEAGEAAIETVVPLQTDVLLDVLIRHDNQENLPGLTLEVVQMAEGGPSEATWEEILASPQRKATWRIWVDTSAIGRGQGASVTYLLEDVAGYAPGDRFVVAVRHPVPEAERGEYREFSEAS